MTDTPGRGELDLARLRFKYEAILALRLRGKGDGPPVAELRALALEFPGALRALDVLTLAHVHDRIDAIVSAELDPGQVAQWMLAELTFAHAMRGVKAVKAWLRGRKKIDAQTHAKFARDVERLHDAALALQWKDDLQQIAQPPRGRLVPLALARVAATLGISAEEATALVFRDDARPRSRSDQDFLGVEEPPPDEPLPPDEPPPDEPPPDEPLPPDEPPPDEPPPDAPPPDAPPPDAPPPDAPPPDEPLPPDEPPPPPVAGAAPEPLPPLPSDFLLELSPPDEEDASEEAPPVAGAAPPLGFDDE